MTVEWWRALALAALLAAAGFAALASNAVGIPRSPDTKRVCFPAARWDGPKAERPCVRVRVYEDGSGIILRGHRVVETFGSPR